MVLATRLAAAAADSPDQLRESQLDAAISRLPPRRRGCSTPPYIWRSAAGGGGGSSASGKRCIAVPVGISEPAHSCLDSTHNERYDVICGAYRASGDGDSKRRNNVLSPLGQGICYGTTASGNEPSSLGATIR